MPLQVNCSAYKSNNYFRLDIYILLIVLGRVLYGFYTKLIVLEVNLQRQVPKNLKFSQNSRIFPQWGFYKVVLQKNKPPSMGFYRGFYPKIIVF